MLGLPAYVLIKVLVPNFFARKDTRTPVLTAACALLLNVALNFILVPRYGVAGLALAGAAGAWTNTLLLYLVLARKGYFQMTGRVAGRIARILLAAVVMGAALWLLVPYGAPYYAGSALERVVAIAMLVLAGGAIYFAAAAMLGVVDRQTIGQLRRRPG